MPVFVKAHRRKGSAIKAYLRHDKAVGHIFSNMSRSGRVTPRAKAAFQTHLSKRNAAFKTIEAKYNKVEPTRATTRALFSNTRLKRKLRLY